MILNFLKGLLMGACDIIPGVSGGTIAFITGIYERLINAIKAFSPSLLKSFFAYLGKRDKKNLNAFLVNFGKLDLVFLVTLFAGIGTALLIGSHIIGFLLEEYFAFTLSFFVGLILASAKVIYDKIEKHDLRNISFGFLGLLFGLGLAFVIPAEVNPGLLYILISGFLAISAMFLPGISGAFILLILGAYEFMLGVLHDILGKIEYFVAFAIGAVLGAFTISRVVSFLFAKDRCKTLYFLLGLVIGSLSIPVKRIVLSTNAFILTDVLIMIVLLVAGMIAVYLVGGLENARG